MSDPRPTLRLVATAAPDPEPAAGPDPDCALSTWEMDMLAFERGWWKHRGAKEQAILDLFGMSSVRYEQTLLVIIEKPEALEHDPMLVNRLRRLRDERRRARSARRLQHR